ncbi:MAG TPA: nitroreductase/quinone reductase family protein [Ktedonobacteraceae bacterium]
MFPNRMRYVAKHVINRLTSRNAGSAKSPFAILRHVGRRSGKEFETPIIVSPLGEDFVFALTYGPKVDWYRNLQANGKGTLIWHGKTYTIKKVEPLDRSIGLSVHHLHEQAILRIMDVRDFVRVKVSAPGPVGA